MEQFGILLFGVIIGVLFSSFYRPVQIIEEKELPIILTAEEAKILTYNSCNDEIKYILQNIRERSTRGIYFYETFSTIRTGTQKYLIDNGFTVKYFPPNYKNRISNEYFSITWDDKIYNGVTVIDKDK
jgi:hypothetical protein